MKISTMKSVVVLLIFLIPVSIFAQTNVWNRLLNGDYDVFGRMIIRSISSAPTELDTLMKLELLWQYKEYWTNTSLITNAYHAVLNSTADPYIKYRIREDLIDQYSENGSMEKARFYREQNGYIDNWKVTGPFTESGSADLETVFPFEKSWSETVPYIGMGSLLQTTVMYPFTIFGEYAPFYGRWPAYGVSYLTSSVIAHSDGVYYLHLQTADPFKIWINGKFIFQQKNRAEKNSTDTFIRLDLKKGSYKVAVKIRRLSRMPIVRVAWLDAGWMGIKTSGHSDTVFSMNTNFPFTKWETIDHAYYRERTENNVGTSENHFIFALMELFNGNENNFVKNIYRAIERDNKSIFYKYYYAQYFLNNNEYPNSSRLNTAITYLKELSESSYPAILDLLGSNEFQNKRYRDAVRFFTKAGSLNQNCFLYQHHLARAYLDRNWENEFIIAAKKSLKINPDYSETIDMLYKYYDNRNSQKADEYRDAYRNRHPYSLDNLVLARSYIYKGRYDDASAIINKMNEMFLNLKELWIIRAEIKMRQGKTEEAMEIYEDLLRKMPEDPQILEIAGKTSLITRQEIAGLKYLKKSSANDPGNNILADRISLLETGHYYDLREYIDIDKDPEILKQAVAIRETKNAESPISSGAIILSDEEVLKLNRDGSWYKLVRQFIKITDKNGIERWGSPSIDNFSRLKVIRACTRLENGEKVDVTEIKKQGSSLVISFPAVKKEVVLELVYLIPGSYMNTVEDTPYFTSEYFLFRTKEDPIRNATCSYVIPKDMNVIVRRGNFNSSIKSSTKTNGDMIVCKFSISDQNALKVESAMPSIVDLVPWTSISTFPNDPKIFRKWFTGLMEPFLECEVEHDEKLFELLDNQDLSNKGIGQIRNIYLWVNRNILLEERDIYSPQKSRKTLDTRAGSSMDKALLMKLFLKRIGINSDLILFRSDSMPLVDISITDPSLYDGVLLKVCFNGRTDYLDMDSRYLAYGDMTWEKFRTSGMNMTSGSKETIPDPDTSTKQNMIISVNDASIDEDGHILIQSSRIFNGCYSVYQEVFMDEETRDLSINQMENQNIRGLSVTNIRFDPIEGTNHYFGYSFQGNISSWLGGAGNEQTLSLLGSKNRLFETYITDMTRKQPLKIYTPIRNRQTVIYRTSGWKIKSIPPNANIKTEYGSFKMEYKIIDESTITLLIETTIPGQTISVSRYDEFVDFCKNVRDAEKKEIVLIK